MKNHWLEIYETKKFLDNIFIEECTNSFDFTMEYILQDDIIVTADEVGIFQIDSITEVGDDMVEILFSKCDEMKNHHAENGIMIANCDSASVAII